MLQRQVDGDSNLDPVCGLIFCVDPDPSAWKLLGKAPWLNAGDDLSAPEARDLCITWRKRVTWGDEGSALHCSASSSAGHSVLPAHSHTFSGFLPWMHFWVRWCSRFLHSVVGVERWWVSEVYTGTSPPTSRTEEASWMRPDFLLWMRQRERGAVWTDRVLLLHEVCVEIPLIFRTCRRTYWSHHSGVDLMPIFTLVSILQMFRLIRPSLIWE